MVFDVVWAVLGAFWLGCWLTGSSVVWHATGRRTVRASDRLGSLLGALAIYGVPLGLALSMTSTVGRTPQSSPQLGVIIFIVLGGVAAFVAALGSLIMWAEDEDGWTRGLRSICWPAAVPFGWLFHAIGVGCASLRLGLLRRPLGGVMRAVASPFVLGEKIANKALPERRV